METKEYINKKNRIKSDLMTYATVNQLRMVSNQGIDSYRIYDKEFCVLEVYLLKQNQTGNLSVRFVIPLLYDFSMANLTVLRPLLGDINIRDFLCNDRMAHSNNILKLVRDSSIELEKPFNRNFVFATITNLFTKATNGVDLISNKMNQILQIKLN